MLLAPEETRPEHVAEALRARGFALLAAADVLRLDANLPSLAASWNDLPPDPHLRDSGHYRFRRHASFIVNETVNETVTRVAHRAHFQPVQYNALHGGIERWFEPMTDAVAAGVGGLIAGIASLLPPTKPWYVEAHQFRIDTAQGIGRPTPEGAHRDGVDYVAIVLVQRYRVKGGETRVFEAAGPAGLRFTIVEPFSMLLLDDSRVIHETTPIQPEGDGGVRDTLVVTFRANGFLNA